MSTVFIIIGIIITLYILTLMILLIMNHKLTKMILEKERLALEDDKESISEIL